MGFNQVRFARDKLHRPPLPWQEFAMIHAGELLPDGRPRFRIVILEVGRQNGKTEIVVILPAYWMFVDDSPLILGTSTKLEYAKETWNKTRKLIARSTALRGAYDAKRWYLQGAGNTEMWTHAYDEDGAIIPGEQGARYKIAAANEEGGRSLTIHRGIADELRQHHDFSAWDAMEPAASYDDSQLWGPSNAGDDRAVVLNMLRAQALAYLEHGIGNYRVGLFSWSAPEDADPEDPAAILQANPRVGYGGKTLEDLQMEAATAVREGGLALTGFKTEKLCIRVKLLNPAIDPGAWMRCKDPDDLTAIRSRLAMCLDMAPDGKHITAVVAGMLPDGRVRAEVAGAWPSALAARAALPALVGSIRPRVFGWFPSGPAAALAADLKEPKQRVAGSWPPPGVTVAEIRGDLSAACMGLEEQVTSRMLAHSDDPLLNAHVGAAEWLKRGDTKVFVRAGDGHVDGAYALAGAVHLARTMPPPIGDLRIVLPSLGGDG